MTTSTHALPSYELTARASHSEHTGIVKSLYMTAARLDRIGFAMLRLGLVVVLCWIGGLKAANYEAEGIVPFVANSPLMSFFYHHSALEYREQNSAGGLNVENHHWAALSLASEFSSLFTRFFRKLPRWVASL